MRSGSGGRRVVRQRLDGDGEARQPLGAAVGGSVRSSMRSTVASASASARGRDREARACQGRRREAPDAAPRPPRGRSPRRAGPPARRLRRAARCRAAPPARRCRDGSWRSGRCRRPWRRRRASAPRASQSAALRTRRVGAPGGRFQPSMRFQPRAVEAGIPSCAAIAAQLSLVVSPSRLASARISGGCGISRMGVLRRGPRGGRPQVQEMRARKNRPARRAGGWRCRGAVKDGPKARRLKAVSILDSTPAAEKSSSMRSTDEPRQERLSSRMWCSDGRTRAADFVLRYVPEAA